MIYDIAGWLVFLLIVCLVGFIIYLSRNPKNRFAAAFDAWKGKRMIETVMGLLGLSFFVIVLGGLVLDSGWYPRTREVVVFADAAKWVPGELRMCFSSEGSAKDELLSLACEIDRDTGETHTLSVRFWGPITTERPKVWKCQREETSLTCKLQ